MTLARLAPPLVALLLALELHGCDRAAAHDEPAPEHAWVRVYTDDQFAISFDSAHVARLADGSYDVWFETVHTPPQEDAGRPWNRETMHDLLRCEPLSFKTIKSTLAFDENPPFKAIGGGTVASVALAPWTPVSPGSADAGTMREACALIRAKEIMAGKKP